MPDFQIPETMRAVVTTGHGGFDKLDYRGDVPVPVPGPGKILIRFSDLTFFPIVFEPFYCSAQCPLMAEAVEEVGCGSKLANFPEPMRIRFQ